MVSKPSSHTRLEMELRRSMAACRSRDNHVAKAAVDLNECGSPLLARMWQVKGMHDKGSDRSLI